jgi:glyoxylase-like metal-dependent hydrolase (beta-lactamase superfamily II)
MSSGWTALVIDAARLPDRQRRLIAERGWRLAWSADTHSHADFISGGSLMVGTVGRTDLLGDEHREELAAELYETHPRTPAEPRLPTARTIAERGTTTEPAPTATRVRGHSRRGRDRREVAYGDGRQADTVAG